MKRAAPSSSSAPRHEAGIALLEVLVSILLFSLGILGLIGLQARAISMSIDAEDRNRAALLANDAASTLWLSKSPSMNTDALEAWKARVADPTGSGLPNGEGTITLVTGTANSADITITWRPPSRKTGDQSSQLTTRVTLP